MAKITDLQIDVIERNPGSVKVQDNRMDLGGKVVQGVLRIKTEDGIEGNAFIGEQGTSSHNQIKLIVSTLKPILIGRESSQREWLWSQLELITGLGQPINAAWAPVDVALWDLAGKQVGLSIAEMLGICKYEIPLYATYPPRHKSSEGFIDEAKQLKDEGFKAYKIHPGNMNVRETNIAITRIREEVGDSFTLMLDRNNGYTLEQALKVGKALDANDYYWFEDPVNVNDYRSIRKLSNSLITPINMSDSATFLFRQSSHFIAENLVTMIRGTSRKLGITGLKKLCSMAEGFGLNCEIGLAGNSLMNAANLHVIMSVSNCTFFEYWRPETLHQWGVVNEISIKSNGKLSVPSEPGLGLILDEDWIQHHKVETI